jgi:hypothetical protein
MRCVATGAVVGFAAGAVVDGLVAGTTGCVASATAGAVVVVGLVVGCDVATCSRTSGNSSGGSAITLIGAIESGIGGCSEAAIALSYSACAVVMYVLSRPGSSSSAGSTGPRPRP